MQGAAGSGTVGLFCVAGALPLVTTRVAIVLFLAIVGIIGIDLILVNGRGSLVAARHFVDLVHALAFWR